MSGSLLIYIVKDHDLLDQHLSIIKIADPELELDIGINVTDSNRAYVISEGNVRTVRTAGKMVRIKQPDGDFSPLFAHDDLFGILRHYQQSRMQSTRYGLLAMVVITLVLLIRLRNLPKSA